MTKNNRATNIIKGKLDVSYEAADVWVDEHDAANSEIYPEAVVLLLTRCCKINHEHISLTRSEATVLAQWLNEFLLGDYDD